MKLVLKYFSATDCPAASSTMASKQAIVPVRNQGESGSNVEGPARRVLANEPRCKSPWVVTHNLRRGSIPQKRPSDSSQGGKEEEFRGFTYNMTILSCANFSC